jgi:hypothetical protein
MATKTKRMRLLKELYATIPSIDCSGKCRDQCTLIPMDEVELLYLQKVADPNYMEPPPGSGSSAPVILIPRGKECQFLVGGRCSVYEHRPLICRLFGVAQGLTCPHGCKPHRTLSRLQAGKILKKLQKI